MAVAPLYGVAVLGIRSLDSSFIMTCGFVSLGLLTSKLCLRSPRPIAAGAVMRLSGSRLG
jgi:hypothetical protein